MNSELFSIQMGSVSTSRAKMWVSASLVTFLEAAALTAGGKAERQFSAFSLFRLASPKCSQKFFPLTK